MGYIGSLKNFIDNYAGSLHMPTVRWTDVLEILIIAYLLYEMFLWMKNTRAWQLLRGIVFIVAFVVVAVLLNMTTILWIAENVLSIFVIGLVVVLQPELRRALEQLGRTNLISKLISSGGNAGGGNISDKTVDEIVRAAFAMGKVKTGALIVIEQKSSLEDYVKTGISVDAIITSQLLINVFEHNTPLHDGAAMVINDRLAAATCYLPLSANRNLSKDLGTRHRAGVGISEETDSMTVIVSEETGNVSVAYRGELSRNLDEAGLKELLLSIQDKPQEDKKIRLWRGFGRNEKETDS